MAAHTLTYFDFRERGEIIRMLFAYAGAPFEDKRIGFEEFGQIKNNSEECPNTYLPILTTPNGTKLVQTASIIRYVANEFNLHGNDNVERAIIDSIIDTMKDIHDSCVKYIWATKDEDKPAAVKTLEEAARKAFTYVQYRAKKNGSKDVMIGSKVSVVDIYLLDVLDMLERVSLGKVVEDFQILNNIATKTRETPAMKKYLSGRK